MRHVLADTSTVQATVSVHADLERIEEPREVTLTAEDIHRGWADIPVGSRLWIFSNSRSGCFLRFEVAEEASWLKLILIRGLPIEAQVSRPGGWLHRRWPGASRSVLELWYRLELQPDAKPGTYPWPLHVSLLLQP